jgi:para-aminobenzoate synthetase/4-amino-4-deoxychorismate lyase
MEIIAEVEESPRGLYCGALGWVDAAPPGQALGAFCLSVGIRTLLVEPPHPANSALRPLRLGVGAGIVLGSRAEGEYAEVMLKARFLTDLDPGFTLFETMLARAGAGVRHLELHLARLAGSARDLGFCCDLGALREGLAERAAGLPPGRDHRLRLDLAKDGRVALTHAPLEPLPGGGEGVALGLCTEPVQPHGLLSRHKTSHRPQYDSALCEIVARGRFDLLFLNGAGELVEGARSNVFLKLEGRWFTPPLSSGALPGIQRSLLLVDPAWGARERVLSGPDLVRAEAIVVCNALRGPLRARLAREARE